MKDYIVVLNTVPEETTGHEIGRRLVEERLAACVTVSAAAKSFYRWEGKIAEEREFVLLIKTKASLFGRLEKRLRELHPYRVPEIVALPIVNGAVDYLAWVDEETAG